MFERTLHSLINVVDRSIPIGLKRQIKSLSPGFADGVYRQLTRFTSDRVVNVRIQGGRLAGRGFFCSLRHQRSCFLGNFEPQKEAILVHYLAPGSVFFDVGGHIGYFSLMAATLVRPAGIVVAFEPSLANAAQFRQNLEANPDLASLIQFTETAVADQVGVASFDRGGNSYIGHLVADSSPMAVKVDTTTLDAFAALHALSPDFVKIDAEGAESRIFQGMTQILSHARPVVLVEIHDQPSYQYFLGVLARYSYVSRCLDGSPQFSSSPDYMPQAEYLATPA
ncbi:MAG: Methyltransferase, FkbM family [Acidobacteria bacterium]|nr:Methyltransferase, FkbM family [Acidobacteriota bacterium]